MKTYFQSEFVRTHGFGLLKVVIKKQAPTARIRILFALQGMAPTPPPLNALLLALFLSPLLSSLLSTLQALLSSLLSSFSQIPLEHLQSPFELNITDTHTRTHMISFPRAPIGANNCKSG